MYGGGPGHLIMTVSLTERKLNEPGPPFSLQGDCEAHSDQMAIWVARFLSVGYTPHSRPDVLLGQPLPVLGKHEWVSQSLYFLEMNMTDPQYKVINLVTLTDQERRAIEAFLDEHWERFCAVAEHYLTDEEIDELGDKLEQE